MAAADVVPQTSRATLARISPARSGCRYLGHPGYLGYLGHLGREAARECWFFAAVDVGRISRHFRLGHQRRAARGGAAWLARARRHLAERIGGLVYRTVVRSGGSQ